MDLWKSIEANLTWSDLSIELRAQLNNDPKIYEEQIILHSYQNQLRYNENIVQIVMKRERKYYEKLVEYGRNHYLLYPYHLQDKIAKGLKITPFLYYRFMLIDLISNEKSYDSIPNFTAADCLRLLGIGRNQYIEFINSYKSFMTSTISEDELQGFLYDTLPSQPIDSIRFIPWYTVNIGSVLLTDIENSSVIERELIDKLIDVEACVRYRKGCQHNGIQVADLDKVLIRNLYCRGLVYIQVPIDIHDRICVQILEGFVMNRVSGDFRENLLYKLFVTLDVNTSIGELADCLQVDVNWVQQAASLFCRLGFANKIISTTDSDSPNDAIPNTNFKLLKSISILEEKANVLTLNSSFATKTKKKLVLIFDSTITAYLMMGNLSSRLKPHAVTMFEAGKLSEESLNTFFDELDKLSSVSDCESKLYHDHAINLRETIRFLRKQASMEETNFDDIDLIRGGSLLTLEPETRSRIMYKNYDMIISLVPSTYEDQRSFDVDWPIHLGPPSFIATSPWFVLYGSCAASGALANCNGDRLEKNKILPTMLLTCGKQLYSLPTSLSGISHYWITAWSHDAISVDASSLLPLLNDMLLTSPVLVQAIDIYALDSSNLTRCYIPLPLSDNFMKNVNSNMVPSFLINLSKHFDLTSISGYIIVLAQMNRIQDEFITPIKQLDTRFESNQLSNDNCNTISTEIVILNEDELNTLSKQKSICLFISLHMGLPIFNFKLNQAVCQQIHNSQLLHTNHGRKQQLGCNNIRLDRSLNQFVFDRCSSLLPNKTDRSYSSFVTATGGDLPNSWPLPTQSFICVDGCLKNV